MGVGVHTKMFKTGDKQITVVMSGERIHEVQTVMDFFEVDQTKYVKEVWFVNKQGIFKKGDVPTAYEM